MTLTISTRPIGTITIIVELFGHAGKGNVRILSVFVFFGK